MAVSIGRISIWHTARSASEAGCAHARGHRTEGGSACNGELLRVLSLLAGLLSWLRTAAPRHGFCSNHQPPIEFIFTQKLGFICRSFFKTLFFKCRFFDTDQRFDSRAPFGIRQTSGTNFESRPGGCVAVYKDGKAGAHSESRAVTKLQLIGYDDLCLRILHFHKVGWSRLKMCYLFTSTAHIFRIKPNPIV